MLSPFLVHNCKVSVIKHNPHDISLEAKGEMRDARHMLPVVCLCLSVLGKGGLPGEANVAMRGKTETH